MKWPFFHKKKEKKIHLSLNYIQDACEMTSWVTDVHYLIYHGITCVGECDLRLGMNDEIYYAGQVGYRIYYPYRGHGYAYEACLLLFSLAKQKYGFHELLITCSPDNIASHKTLEKLHGTFLKTVNVPKAHWLYQRGETVKEIYYYSL